VDQVKPGKKEIVIREEIKREAKHIADDFCDFTHGYRCLFLIHRNKEGGETNNTKARKLIVNGEKEYQQMLSELLTEQFDGAVAGIPYRIYASVNPRDIAKAIRQFKYEQLDADYFDESAKVGFYLDIKNRFLGCLMQPRSRADSRFIFDIDTEDNSDFLKALPSEVPILKMYRTKNGWHAITEPFNHTQMVMPPFVSINVDGLLLLKY
jgi:hypothetical protein